MTLKENMNACVQEWEDYLWEKDQKWDTHREPTTYKDTIFVEEEENEDGVPF